MSRVSRSLNQVRKLASTSCRFNTTLTNSIHHSVCGSQRPFSSGSDGDGEEMEYRLLGGTGLKVSTLSFGFWGTYGVKEGIERCVSVLRICRNNGINLFDNAETYGVNVGDAERIMGQSIKILKKENPILWRRSDIVVTTKLFWGGPGQNEKGMVIFFLFLFLFLFFEHSFYSPV